jgi:predicted transcriptional regulator
MEHLIKPLQNIGFSDKEAKVYLTLLQLGPSNPYKIAKRAGLKRPTAYVVAEELIRKNIIVTSPGKKHIYIARPAETVFEEHEKKVLELKKTLPELKALQGGLADKPTVLYFEGHDGLRQAFMYKVKEIHDTEIVGFYANPDFVNNESLKIANEFNEYRVKHNITIRGLLTESESLKDYEKYIRDRTLIPKFIPKDVYSSNASFEFFPSFIKIIFFDTELSVIIESPTVAKAMKQIFEMLWARLGDEYKESRVIK